MLYVLSSRSRLNVASTLCLSAIVNKQEKNFEKNLYVFFLPFLVRLSAVLLKEIIQQFLFLLLNVIFAF